MTAYAILRRNSVLIIVLASCFVGQAFADGRALNACSAQGLPSSAPYPVFFRFDDVQDYWLADSQASVIDLFVGEEINLMLAVIGGVIGSDNELVGTISRHKKWLTVVNHGWHATNSEDGRSALLGQSSRRTRENVQNTNRRIKEVLGVTPNVFVPHQLEYDEPMLEAIESLEFKAVFAGCPLNVGSNVCIQNCGVQRLVGEGDSDPLTVIPTCAAFQWRPEVGKKPRPVEQIIDDVRGSIKNFCMAAVMLHPQDFSRKDGSVNQEALGVLAQLLKELKSQPDEYRLVSYDQISEREHKTGAPSSQSE